MHNGDDTAFYLARNFRVVAIDADPTLVNAARSRFAAQIQSGRLSVLNVGIADSEGEADFWVCERFSEWNSFHRSIASRDNSPHHSIRVPVASLSSIFEGFGVPFYLKVDIEGNDRLCLEALAGVAAGERPAYVSWESDITFCADAHRKPSKLDRVHELGYSRFKLIDQSTFEPVEAGRSFGTLVDAVGRSAQRRFGGARTRALFRRMTYRGRLEKKFSTTFPMGSSGPWGEHMPGRWMTYAQARSRIREIAQHFRADSENDYTTWWDWHAAR
jgi:FkbM family methyltransferase